MRWKKSQKKLRKSFSKRNRGLKKNVRPLFKNRIFSDRLLKQFDRYGSFLLTARWVTFGPH